MENIRYLIGIDFGHGETTASVYDLVEDRLTPLNIKNAADSERKKIESCVFRNPQTGAWSLTENNAWDIFTQFKAPVGELENDPTKREAFAMFVQLVFDNILQYNSQLIYDPGAGRKNFLLYAACPSGWGQATGHEDEIERYRRFLSELIPVEWVVKESDAAFFKFRNDANTGSVLVIDLGSSTIDITCYGTADQRGPWGFANGASMVENSIYLYARRNIDGVEQAIAQVRRQLQSEGENIINFDFRTLRHIKHTKENYYTDRSAYFLLDARGRDIYSKLSGQRIFDGIEFDHEQMTRILADYRHTLLDNLREVAGEVTPDNVILTGGASRMPWVQTLVGQVFPKANLMVDSNPSYVVSDGVALYAYAKHTIDQRWPEFQNKVNNRFTDSYISTQLNAAFTDAMRDIFLPRLQAIADSFTNGTATDSSGVCSISAFFDGVRRLNQTIINDNSGTIVSRIRDVFNRQLSDSIHADIEALFRQTYGISIPFDIDMKLKVTVNGTFDDSTDQRLVELMGEDAFLPFGIGMLNLSKDRSGAENRDKRRRFGEKFINAYRNDITFVVINELQSRFITAIHNEIHRVMSDLQQKAPFATYR